MKMPNGVIRAKDGLIYVANTIPGEILVFSLTDEHRLVQVDSIHIGLPLDNLSIDSEGNIFAAAFPKAYRWTESTKNPDTWVPTAIFKISRKDKTGYGKFSRKEVKKYEGGYVVEKIIEDDGGELPASTVAVHDPKTGKVFLSGILSFVSVCETR